MWQAIVGLVVLAVLLVVAVMLLLHSWYEAHNPIGFVRLPEPARQVLLGDLTQLPQGARVIDLGCGNGHILRELRRRRPDLTCVGIDNNIIVVALGRLQSRINGDGVRLLRGDLLKYEVAGFDVVVTYLYPPLMQALEPKFEHDMKPGAQVWSVQFPLPQRPPSSETPLPGKPYAARLYRYQY